jgi:hypothetical protein
MGDLVNFYEFIKQDETPNPNYEQHKIKIPFRMLICCASGGGKTNYVLNLLALFNNTFTRLIISTKAEEKLYDYLQEKIKKVEVYLEGKIPEITKMPKGQSGLLILDDLCLDKKPEVGQMYIRGRKLSFSTIYITQSFYQVEKIIRQNCNIICLGYGLQSRDLRMILSEFALGITLDELIKIYNEATAIKMNFLMINLDDRTIRRNITEIIREF